MSEDDNANFNFRTFLIGKSYICSFTLSYNPY